MPPWCRGDILWWVFLGMVVVVFICASINVIGLLWKLRMRTQIHVKVFVEVYSCEYFMLLCGGRKGKLGGAICIDA